ncbi:MAG TPA: hypothetical protein VKX16_19125 [Chloroflexota bacterium]|nr:hypothetical protein [Chloroflexota bacterium]
MTATLSFEWLKLSRRWMPRVLLVMLIGMLVFYFWGQGTRLEERVNMFFPRAWLATLFFSSFCAPFFWPVLGGSWAGNEYGWGTIRMILTRRPYRIQHVLAALVVLCAALVVALFCMLIVGSAAGVVIGAATGHAAITSGVLTSSFLNTTIKTFAAAWYVAVFYLVLGYAAAVVFRSAAVGIGVGIGSTLAQFVLYAVLRDMGGVWQTIAQHFPIIYTESIVQDIAARGFAAGTGLDRINPGDPSISSSVAAITIFTAVALAAALLSARIRDVTE